MFGHYKLIQCYVRLGLAITRCPHTNASALFLLIVPLWLHYVRKNSHASLYPSINIKLNYRRLEVYKPFWEFDPMRSDVLGVEVTWRRPMATRQQWEAPWASSSPRSIYKMKQCKVTFGEHSHLGHKTLEQSKEKVCLAQSVSEFSFLYNPRINLYKPLNFTETGRKTTQWNGPHYIVINCSWQYAWFTYNYASQNHVSLTQK